MNPVSQGIMSLPPGTLPLNNIAAGHYRLEVLDNNDRVTKTMDIERHRRATEGLRRVISF